MYSVPFYGESSFLMYRKDLFEQAGIKVDQTRPAHLAGGRRRGRRSSKDRRHGAGSACAASPVGVRCWPRWTP